MKYSIGLILPFTIECCTFFTRTRLPIFMSKLYVYIHVYHILNLNLLQPLLKMFIKRQMIKKHFTNDSLTTKNLWWGNMKKKNDSCIKWYEKFGFSPMENCVTTMFFDDECNFPLTVFVLSLWMNRGWKFSIGEHLWPQRWSMTTAGVQL